MKRRNFIATALAGLGLASLPATRSAIAQDGAIAPIASASLRIDGDLVIARLYPARQRGDVIMMLRSARGDEYRRLSLSGPLRPVVQAIREERGFEIEAIPQGGAAPVDIRVSGLSMPEQGIFEFDYAFGDVRGRGAANGTQPEDDDEGGSGSGSGGGGGGGGGTEALGVGAVIVILAALLAAVAAYAIHEGVPLSARLKVRGIEYEISVGEAPPEGGGGSGFQHDPICDTMPPMNC